MLITRWQAKEVPSIEQLKMILLSEGQDLKEEIFPGGQEIGEHKHPFEEIRIIHTGRMIFNFTGNKVLLRSGDKIIIPPNTKHSMEVQGEEECSSIVAYRPF
ncbi:MAG: cupin domain-containing protein [Bdellovibrionales bacterium]